MGVFRNRDDHLRRNSIPSCVSPLAIGVTPLLSLHDRVSFGCDNVCNVFTKLHRRREGKCKQIGEKNGPGTSNRNVHLSGSCAKACEQSFNEIQIHSCTITFQ